MAPRWFVLLALSSPVTAADPRTDPEGMPLPDGCLARLGSTRFRAWNALRGPTFTPAGELLFTEHDEQTVRFRFMNAATGLFVRTVTLREAQLVGTGSWETVLGVSDDGRTFAVLAAAPGTQQVHVVTWDIAAGRVVARIPIDVKSGVPSFSDNFRFFAQYDRDTGDVTVTDARTGRRRQACRVDPESRPDLFPAPDGESVVVCADTVLTAFAVPTGRPIREIVRSGSGKSLTNVTVRYSADGGTVVARVGGKDETAGVWRCDLRTGARVAVPISAEQDNVSGLSPDGARLVAACQGARRDVLLNLRSGDEFNLGGPFRTAVRFDARSRRFVTRDAEGVTVRDAGTGKPVCRPMAAQPTELRFQDDGKILIGYSKNRVTRWEVATGREVNRFDRPAEWRGLPFANGRKVFAEVAPGEFVLQDTLTGKRDAANWRFLSSARAWHPTACGRYVVAAFSNDGQTRIQKYAVSSGEVVAELHGLPLRLAAGLSVSGDGSRVVVSGADRERNDGPPTLNQTFTCDLNAAAVLHAPRPYAGVIRHALSADGRRVPMSPTAHYSDHELDPVPDGVYDAASGVRVAEVSLKEDWVGATSADGRVFAVGEDSGWAELYEAATGGLRTRFRHRNEITAIALSPDGTVLAAASADAPVYLWDVCGRLRNLPTTFDARTGERLWQALEDGDAAKAFDAMQRLAAASADAVSLFARKLPPATAPTPEWYARRRDDLGSREFTVRDRATRDLVAAAELVRPWLERDWKRTGSPEARRRLKTALAAIGANTSGRLRVLRCTEILGWLRTPPAVDLLKVWAGGAAAAPLTLAARQTLRQR